MARDHDQSDDAGLGAAVQLDNAETLDGAVDGDALDAGYVPPDRPYGLDEDNVTAAGMRAGDSLDERLRREEPEGQQTDRDRSGRLADPEFADPEFADPELADPEFADPELADPELAEQLVEGRDGSRAARIDAARDAGGAAASASGRDDVGPGSGL